MNRPISVSPNPGFARARSNVQGHWKSGATSSRSLLAPGAFSHSSHFPFNQFFFSFRLPFDNTRGILASCDIQDIFEFYNIHIEVPFYFLNYYCTLYYKYSYVLLLLFNIHIFIRCGGNDDVTDKKFSTFYIVCINAAAGSAIPNISSGIVSPKRNYSNS